MNFRSASRWMTFGSIVLFCASLATPGADAQQWTGPDGSGNINNTNTGNVGIATSMAQPDHDPLTPSAPLHIGKITTFHNVNVGSLQTGYFPGIMLQNTSTLYQVTLTENSGLSVYITPTFSGNVSGSDLRLKVDTSGITVTGNIVATGNVAAKYQDLAEWVPANADMAPGTVVVIDRKTANSVIPSSRAEDTAVAGVVSAEPGLILGESGPSKVRVSTAGRVKVRADATKHPIHIGDLLVTSNRAGMAMVSEPVEVAGVKIYRPGTILGKALEPLASGEGEILVLLSLQ